MNPIVFEQNGLKFVDTSTPERFDAFFPVPISQGGLYEVLKDGNAVNELRRWCLGAFGIECGVTPGTPLSAAARNLVRTVLEREGIGGFLRRLAADMESYVKLTEYFAQKLAAPAPAEMEGK